MRIGPREGTDLFQSAIDAFGHQSSPEKRHVWARLQARYAQMLMLELYRDDISEMLASGLEIAKECHDKAEIAFCLMLAGKNQNRPDLYPASVPLFEESLQYYQEINDQYYVAELNSCLGHHARLSNSNAKLAIYMGLPAVYLRLPGPIFLLQF